MSRSVARRYAKAILEIAKQDNSIEQIKSDLGDFQDSLSQSEELKSILKNPKANTESKKLITQEICKKNKSSKTVSNFLGLLTEKHRLEVFEDIHDIFNELANKELGKEKVLVTVAEDIDDSVKKDIKAAMDQYSKKDVEVDVKVDPAIIGGIVSKIGSVVIDGSVKNRLNSMRQTITNR